MKKILSLIAVAAIAVFSSLSVNAQEEATYLVVNLKDGKTEQFLLPDEPVVKVENHIMSITSTTMECEYEFDNVSHFSFKRGTINGIDEVNDNENSFSFTFVDNNTVIITASGLQYAAMYDVRGLEVARANADNDTVTLNISNVAPGVYIIAPSCHSAIKIIKR